MKIKYNEFNLNLILSSNSNMNNYKIENLFDDNFETYNEFKFDFNSTKNEINIELKEINEFNRFAIKQLNESQNLINEIELFYSIDGINYISLGLSKIIYEYQNNNKKQHIINFNLISAKYFKININSLNDQKNSIFNISEIDFFYSETDFKEIGDDSINIIESQIVTNSNNEEVNKLIDQDEQSIWKSTNIEEIYQISILNQFEPIKRLNLYNISNISSPINIKMLLNGTILEELIFYFDEDDKDIEFKWATLDKYIIGSEIVLEINPINSNSQIQIGEIQLNVHYFSNYKNTIKDIKLNSTISNSYEQERQFNQMKYNSRQNSEVFLEQNEIVEIYLEQDNQNDLFATVVSEGTGYNLDLEKNVFKLNKGYNKIIAPQEGVLCFVNEHQINQETEYIYDIKIIGGYSIPIFYKGENSAKFIWEIFNRFDVGIIWKSQKAIAFLTKDFYSKDNFLEYLNDLNPLLNLIDEQIEKEEYWSGFDNSSFHNQSSTLGYFFTGSNDINSVKGRTTDNFISLYDEGSYFLININYYLEAKSKAPHVINHEIGHVITFVKNEKKFSSFSEQIAEYFAYLIDRYQRGKDNYLYKEYWIKQFAFEFANNDLVYPNKDFFEYDQGNDSYDLSTMFTQLELAFTKENISNYFKYLRNSNIEVNQDKYDQSNILVKTISEFFGYNLIDFFTKWGFNIYQDTIEYINNLNLINPNVDINTFTLDYYIELDVNKKL